MDFQVHHKNKIFLGAGKRNFCYQQFFIQAELLNTFETQKQSLKYSFLFFKSLCLRLFNRLLFFVTYKLINETNFFYKSCFDLI